MDTVGQGCFFFSSSVEMNYFDYIFQPQLEQKWQNIKISPSVENFQDCSLLNRLRLLAMITPAKIFHLNDLLANRLGYPKQK